MSNRWMMVRNGVVENIIVWDGGAWGVSDGYEIIPEIEGVGMGWRLVDGVWVAPEEPVVDQPVE